MDLKRDGSSSERASWGLPHDVEDLVLARLPISALYKVRPVCKRWHSLLTDPSFLSLRNEIQCQHETTFFPLVFWHDGKATLRISRTGSRLESIDDLEPIYPHQTASTDSGCETEQAQNQCATWSWLGYDSSRRRWQALKPFSTPIDIKNVITGSKGLLCLRGQTSLLVVNPMTGARRQIPLEENIVQLVGSDTESSSFKIICVASRKRTKIYDSQTRLWTKRGRPPPNLSVSKDLGAYSDGLLFCVAREERTGMWGVIQYTVEGARTWSHLIFFPTQVIGASCVKAKVIQFGGEIFALIEQDIDEGDIGSRAKRLSLWKLGRGYLTWSLAGTMPSQSLQHLENLEDFDCVPLNDRVCILNKSTFKAVVCFISNGVVTSWHELPLDSYFSADTPLVERCIVQFPFEPSLGLGIFFIL